MEQMKSGKSKNIDDGIWQDREIRFDTKLDQLEMRSGELQIDSINSVEDTKGNNGEKGSLSITNLRLIWICHRNSRINLSIGYNAVVSINIRTANSRLRGNTQATPAATAAATRTRPSPDPHPNLLGDTQALYVMTKFNNSRFEFVFTNLVRQSPRLFTTVQAVYRAYDTSRLYRDLKLRGAIIRNKSLILLPNEQMYNKVPHTTCHLPPATYHLPPTTSTYHLPPPPTTYHLPPTTYHLPPTYQLLTTYRCSVPPTLATGAGRVEPLVRPGQPRHLLHHQRAARVARQHGGELQRLDTLPAGMPTTTHAYAYAYTPAAVVSARLQPQPHAPAARTDAPISPAADEAGARARLQVRPGARD